MSNVWDVFAALSRKWHDTAARWLVLGVAILWSSSALAQTGSLSGQVLRQVDGDPVVGATVYLYQGEDPEIADDDAWWWVDGATTDSEGRYVFENLAQRRYRVQFEGQSVAGINYFQVNLYNVQVLSGAETANMDLVVRQAALLYGYVKTSGGDPINAMVVLEGDWTEHGQDWYGTWTDQNGRYEFFVADSPGKFYTVYTAEASRGNTYYASSWKDEFYKATLAGTQVPDFVLGLGGTVRGRVVNESGVGIQSVHIEVGSNPQGRWEGPWTDTDANGDFMLHSVAPGTNYIVASNGWNEIQQDGVKYMAGETNTGALNIVAGETIEVDPFVIYRAGRITGVVTDEAGTPVVGAEVELEGKDIHGDDVYRDTVVTDAFGQYEVDYVAPGTYSLRCWKDGFMAASVSELSVAREQHVDRDLVLRTAAQGATLQGKIANYASIRAKDADGVALPSYENNDYEDYGFPSFGIIAFSMDREWNAQDFLRPDGRFIDQRDLENIDDGYGDYFQNDPGESPGNYGTWLLPPGDVALGMYYQQSQRSGEMWSVLLGGWKRLNLSKGDVRTGVDFTWEAPVNPGTLKGNLSAPAGYSSYGYDWAMVYAFRLDESGNPVGVLPMGDAVAGPGWTKAYEFQALSAGSYTLRAYAKNLASVTLGSVAVSAGQTTTQTITFTAGGTVAGQVTDGANPVVGATVTIVETGAKATTDASGNYSLPGLNAGSYTVKASAATYAPAQATVGVTAGVTTTQNFALTNTASSIAGTVKDLEGGNVNGATVLAYNETDKSQATCQTVAGAFTLGSLTPGSYILSVNTEQYGVVVYPAGNGRITLAAGQDLTGVAITVGTPVPPVFSVHSSVSDGTPVVLSMEFSSNRDLSAAPEVTIVAGEGTLGSLTSNAARNRFEIQYTAHADDTLVRLQIRETTALVPGNLGSQTFSFEVSSNLVMTNTTNVTNATGGTASIMGTQDNTQVYVPPFAIAGTDSTEAVPLTIERYGDPGDTVAGDQTATAVYDFKFEDQNVQVEQNHTFTVTMSFRLPAGMTQEEFESSLSIKYFDVGDEQWKTDGITNVRINWVNQTIMFEVSHLTKFAGFLDGETPLIQDPNNPGNVSIIGDVPPFVQCVYFNNCAPGVDTIGVGDCNHDGFLSIIGDVPCFVDCVYFQRNCPE